MSPYESDDLTEIIEEHEGKFIVLRSPDTAEHASSYDEIASFSTMEEAEAYLAAPSDDSDAPAIDTHLN